MPDQDPNQGGTLDDMMEDLSAQPQEPEEEGPGLYERGKDVKDQMKKGKEKYDKLTGKTPAGEEAAGEAGTAGKAGAGAVKTGTGAAKGAKATKAGAAAGKAAKTGATAAKAGATAAKAGAAAGEVGAAAAAGAPTGGVGALVVLGADLLARVASWAKKHQKTLIYIFAFLVFCSLLIFMIAGASIAYTIRGGYGKSVPDRSGPDSPNVQALLGLADKPTDVMGYSQVVFKVQEDRDYVQSGETDDRLLEALNYLASKHKMVRISHIISDYKDMNVQEAGTDTDPQIIQNISAHKDGLAGDLDQIDFVYKVLDAKTQTVVFNNDLNEELLRFDCKITPTACAVTPNTTYKDALGISSPAEAIPIKILYQDPKPLIEHAGNEPDPSLNFDPIEQLIYQKVYQPEARRKVNQAISELLQFPYDKNDTDRYRITQLITYSQERDVDPFQEDGTLDELYGMPRPKNFGLFSMLEAWQNIHIGY